MTSTYVVAVGVADVRREPDASSELVTQALMNRPVVAGESVDGWKHVTLSDYEGWIHTSELEEPIGRAFCRVGEYCSTPLPLVAVVTATHASVFEAVQGEEVHDKSVPYGEVYLSTALPLLNTSLPERVQVAVPGERTGWLSRSAMAIRQQDSVYPRTPISVITAYARAFLGVPYLWGGTSWKGIDCSGLVQLCYRMGGYTLPRDGDQQHDMLEHTVERSEMQEGDLIFFGRTQITHVAMALNEHEYIHAEGQDYGRVIINSFKPADPHYHERLDRVVWDIKRVVSSEKGI